MKELTIEEKAKRYDEAIEIARKLNNGEGVPAPPNWTAYEVMFPELKESEDDRIRQRIIHALHGDVLEMSEIKEAIAWLEKKSTPAKLSEEEQNRFAKGVLTSCALSFIDYLDAYKYEGKMCVSNGECEDIENAFHNAMWDKLHRYYCKYIEKQGESYTKRDVDDAYLKEVTTTKNEIEKQYEATYQIRKDIATFIFNYRGDIKDRAKWMDYLGIKVSFIEEQGEQKPTIVDIMKNYFATTPKEQQDKDWEELKHLNDIGPDIEIAFGAKDSELVEATYYIPKGFYAEIDGDKVHIKKGEQKPVWSEEDERIYQSIMDDTVQENQLCDEQTNYLKDLKDRVQHQTTWKPSDEQIDALEHFVRSIGESGYAHLALQ